MSFQQLLNRLYTLNRSKGISLGTERMRSFCTLFGNPQNQFPTVHIAGTNGKGSVATKIAKGLESIYPQVGLYTSPHISSFRERIRVNGEMISIHETERILSAIIDLPGTFFEITTLLAFLYFAEKKVDYAVIETGLGGRLDATNVVLPNLCVITSIDIDHSEFLGETIEEIAREKAGIIKQQTPVVLGPKAHMIASEYSHHVFGSFNRVEEENNAIASRCMELLNIPKENIQTALKARPPCRMETIKNVILDVAHNPDALKRYFQEDIRRPLEVVCTFSSSKDLNQCMQIIAEHAERIHLVDPPNKRCAPSEVLREILLQHNFPSPRILCHHAVSQAVESASNLGDTAVLGSFFIMSKALAALGRNYTHLSST